MWKLTLLFALGLQNLQTGFTISQDKSVRSFLGNFNMTRNNHVTPAAKSAARDYIVKTFKDFGLDTWTEEFSSNQNKFPGINIIGRVNGRHTGTSNDKILIIAAHYDTVQITKGVDDNGSGMTVLLQALRQYKNENNMKCTQNYTLLFVAFDLEENQPTCQTRPCSCSGILCGSEYFVANLTRYIDNTKATLQGAYNLDTVMNYDTTPNSQILPKKMREVLPDEYNWISSRNFTGDWLAVIGRKIDDSVLSNQFVANFKQGAFNVFPIGLPFTGKPSHLAPPLFQGMKHFFRSDHSRFWNSNNSWPAVFLTDTANFRGFMTTCYHQQCDNMDQVTPEMITFMGKTADALVGATQSLTERVCTTKESCQDKAITIYKITISSPSYPSKYPNGMACSWYREFAETNVLNVLEFKEFDLEESVNCKNDVVEVLAGSEVNKTNRIIGRYCGSTKPETIRYSGEKVVKVRFVSDAFVSGKGFQIVWYAKAPGWSEAGRIGFLQVFCMIVGLAVISPFQMI